MIGRLRGTLAEKQPPHLILDVNGLGYELEVPMTTLYRLPSVGEPLTLHTHLVVREDAQLLYGFFGKRERDFFRELIRLNGCLLYTSPSPRDATLSRMPSSA